MKSAATILLALALSCSAAARDNGPALVIGKASDLATIDPGATITINDFAPIALAYERLLRFEVRDGAPTGVLQGELARSWALDANGRDWTVVLDSGHRFDDGSDVTCDSVRFSFERMLKLGLGPAQALTGLKTVVCSDAMTVRFDLAAPSPIFPQILALTSMSVINPAVMQHARGGDMARAYLSDHTAGSGAYRVTSWQRGQRIALATNPHAKTRPRYFSRVLFKVLKDDAARRTQLRKGDIDLYEGVTPDGAERLAASQGLRVVEGEMPFLLALPLNNQRAPLDRLAVRQAIAFGIDTQAIVQSVLRGHASTVNGLLPAGVPGHDPSIPAIRRNVDEARRKLAEAGVAPGTRLTLSYIPTSEISEATVLAVQSQLADIGLTIAIEPLAPSAFAKVRRGDFDIALGSWFADFPDPWPILQFAYSSENIGEGLNLARYGDAESDLLLRRAEASVDTAERLALYRQAQTRIAQAQPMVQLFAMHGLLALRSDIGGLNYNFWQPGLYNIETMYRSAP